MTDGPVHVVDGQMVEFEVDGEKRQIHCYRCSNGDGYYFRFLRGNTEYPLRLSSDGMNAMLAVFHAVAFGPKHQSESGEPNGS